MRPVEQQFRWAVQALAEPAEVQPALFPPFVVVADELALEFDAWREAFTTSGGIRSKEQREAVAALDQQLTGMSGPDHPDIWLDEGCLNHPQWTEVRRLAKVALDTFGWPPGRPPPDRATFVPSE